MKARVEILVSHLALLSTLRTRSQYLTWMVTFISATYKGHAYTAIRGHLIALMRAQLFSQAGEGESVDDAVVADTMVEDLLQWVETYLNDIHGVVDPRPEAFATYFDIDTMEECVAFMESHPDGNFALPIGMSDPSPDAPDWGEQAGFTDVQEGFSLGVDTFKAIRNTPYYTHARKVIAMCFSASVLNESLFQAHPWFHKRLFAGIDAKNGVDPVDLLDEVLDLSNAVLRAAAQCVMENSMGPLLGRGQQAVSLDTDHAWLKAHIDFYKNGLLQTVTEAEGKVVSDPEFFGKLTDHLRDVKVMHSTSKGAERVNLAARLNAVSIWMAEVTEILARASSRIEPYMVCLHGRTGQGKTVLANLMIKHLLQCNKYPHTQEYLSQVDPDSNFEDSITNKTMGVFIDDLANTKPQFAMNNELMTIIRLKNTSNVPVSKAALEDKGRTFHQCKVVVVSTNADKLGAEETQIEHSAILRRFDSWITMTTKPGYERVFECEGDCRPLKMIDPSKLTDGIYTDAQEFTFRKWMPLEVSPGSTKTDTGQWVVAKNHDGTPLDKVSYNTAARYLAIESQQHFKNQDWLRKAYQYDESLPICPHGGTTAPFCPDCRSETPGLVQDSIARGRGLAVQGGAPSRPLSDEPPELIDDPITAFFLPRSADVTPDASVTDSDNEVAEEAPLVRVGSFQRAWLATHERFVAVRCRASRTWDSFTNVPAPDMEPRAIGLMRAWSNGRFDLEDFAILNFDKVMTGLCCVAPVLATACSGIFALFGFGYAWLTLAWVGVFLSSTRVLVASARSWISGRIAGETLANLKKRSLALVSRYMGALGVFIMVLGAIKGVMVLTRSKPKPKVKVADESFDIQGGTVSMSEPLVRQNVWERRALANWYSLSPDIKSMTVEQMMARISRQLFVMTIHYGEVAVTSNCLVVATNYLVAPAHNFLSVSGEWSTIERIDIASCSPETGPSYMFKVCPEQCHRLPGDMMLVQTNAGGSMPNVLDFIAEGEPVSAVPIVELYRIPASYEIQQLRYMVAPDRVECEQRGWRYLGFVGTRPTDTFKGLCGAAIVAGMRYPKIVALHTMGAGQIAASCRLNARDIREGIEVLKKAAVSRVRVVEQPGKELYVPVGMESQAEVAPLVERSVFREAPVGLPIQVLGTLPNYVHTRSRSLLGPSPYATLVSKVCGVEIKHGPPKNIGKATVEKTKLFEMSESGCLPVEDLLLARKDLKDEMVALGNAMNFWPQVRVLTREEAAAGVMGVSTIRSMNLKTSAGFPFTGAKKKLMVHSPMEGLPDAYVLDERMSKELDRVIEMMSQLRRPNFVFKGSHKDEPTKLTKEKVRIFEGSPLVLTTIVRMYILPVLRMMMLAREQSCSAVGVDATSSEWHTMFTHVKSYNPSAAVIGDWKHYDTSEYYGEMMTMFSILIEIAEEFGSYSEADLCVMTVACEEIARHITLLRGDVAECEGVNPSGQGATVDLNNGVGALRFRCAFYSAARELTEVQPTELWELSEMRHTSGGFRLTPGTRAHFEPLVPMLTGRFADYVRCMFYGDDFMSAVRDVALAWYNQVTLCEYFARHGLALTDAHKQPLTEPTIEWGEVTFLKRGFRWEERVQAYQAPLELDSIYKSLFVWPRKRVMDDESHLAEGLIGACRELYQHGEVVFEERVPALLQVAEMTGITGLLAGAPVTYAQLERAYKAKRLEAKIAVAELEFGTE